LNNVAVALVKTSRLTAEMLLFFMASWSNYLIKLGYRVDRRLDSVKSFVQRFEDDALIVWPYLTYGTGPSMFIKGRVIEARMIRETRADASRWENFRNTLRRFRSDEVRGASVRVQVGQDAKTLLTDDEGFFEGWLSPKYLNEGYLQTLHVELLAPLRREQTQTHFFGQVIVPPPDAAFGVISDIDDTILQSDATRLLLMARKVLFGNARTRLPFEGVASFYHALHQEKNPMFYVSSSPWNLYDVLIEFLDVNAIPLGPLLLRDWGMSASESLPTGHAAHKLKLITQILDTYPALPFILIGDSGQEDPEIYSQVVSQYPGRILAVYIRDVSEGRKNQKISDLAQRVLEAKSELLLVPDTSVAEKHARSRGWLN
jgi:phosphatidate phosphatase APP1